MSNISGDTERWISHIYDLLRISFPSETKYSLDYMKWLYLDNPSGTCISTNLVIDGIVKATYAILPMQYATNGQPLDAALSLNTATHPDERGKRWFTKLAEETYYKASNAGIKIILGVANENSIKGFTKYLGFECLGRVSLRIASPSAHYRHMQAQLSSFNRSADYWHWRLRNPSARYSVVNCSQGLLLLAKRKIPVIIGNLDCDTQQIPTSLLASSAPLLPSYIFANEQYGLNIPHRLLPSPWYFIVKNLGLSDNEFAELKKNAWFHGIDSDTF